MDRRRFEFFLEPLPRLSSETVVFYDPKKKRNKLLLLLLGTLSLLAATWVTLFFGNIQQPERQVSTGSTQNLSSVSSSQRVAANGMAAEPKPIYAETEKCAREASAAFAAMADTVARPRVFAHVPVALEWSHFSVGRSCDVIDVLIPDWLTIVERDDTLSLEVVGPDTRRPLEEAVQAAASRAETMPRIQITRQSIASSFDQKLSAPKVRQALMREIVDELRRLKNDGACLDFGQHIGNSPEPSLVFAKEFQFLLDTEGMTSCIIIGEKDLDWLGGDEIAQYDHIVVKSFYEPWVGSSPVPLSSQDWFSSVVDRAQTYVDEERLVIALGSFASQWTTGVPEPKRLSFAEAMTEIAEYKARLSYDHGASGSFATFVSSEGSRQQVWMLDAASLHNQISKIENLGIQNIGVWSLGFEDPGIWPLLASNDRPSELRTSKLTSVLINNYVQYSGIGPALKISDRPQIGFRNFDLDPGTGLVLNQNYSRYPKPYYVERYAQPAPNELILTFDDGPHAKYTTQILDILKSKETPGVFFALGQSVMAEPKVLERIFLEGHEIGAHSFTHPRMDLISSARTTLEHDLTDRIIASTTGHQTTLYREPFLRSGGPIHASRIPALETVQSNGSIIFGMDVVPKDWTGLSGDEIADYVIKEVLEGNGNVILLHDGGDNREASVAALPVIIDELTQMGYKFTTASKVLEVPKEQLMPKVSGTLAFLDKLSFSFAASTVNTVHLVFWIVLTIGLGRACFITVLAISRKRHKILPSWNKPSVAVIIPAFNEQASVANCIESVLASRYKNLEAVVVNDGSSDNTLNEALKFKHKKNVRVILQPNQGKWAALNRALLCTDAEIVVCIDADTQIEPDAIEKLVSHFSNPKVGAVAGNVVVGNQVNLITKMQALEYTIAQNFERNAFERINGILVVPGALGAWRHSALKQVGLFCDETLTEDADVTMAVNRAGFKVLYDERAVAQTEVPETVRGLMKQRLRWSLGMFQAAWKNKVAARERRTLGLISIPDTIIFGYLFPILAPIADLLVVFLLYSALQPLWSSGDAAPQGLFSKDLLWAYLILPAVELLVAIVAVLIDPRAKLSQILIWPLMRVVYRPILYTCVFRALLRALSGRLANWGPASRKGHDFLRLEKTV